jgi:hypothetical protein
MDASQLVFMIVGMNIRLDRELKRNIRLRSRFLCP